MPNINILNAYKPQLPDNNTLKLIDQNDSIDRHKSKNELDSIKNILLNNLHVYYHTEILKIPNTSLKTLFLHQEKYADFINSSSKRNKVHFQKFLKSEYFKRNTIFACLNNPACNTLREEHNDLINYPSEKILTNFNQESPDTKTTKIIDYVKQLTKYIHKFNKKFTVLGLQYLDIPNPRKANFQFIPSDSITFENIQNQTFTLHVPTLRKVIKLFQLDNPNLISDSDLKFTLEIPDEYTKDYTEEYEDEYGINSSNKRESKLIDALLFGDPIKYITQKEEEEAERERERLYYPKKDNLYDYLESYTHRNKEEIKKKKEEKEQPSLNFWEILRKDKNIPESLFPILKAHLCIIPSKEFYNTIKTRYKEILTHLRSIYKLISTPNIEKLNIKDIKSTLEYFDIDFTGKHGLTYQDKTLYDLIVILEEITSGLIVEFLDIRERINHFLLMHPDEKHRQVLTFYSNKFHRYCISIFDVLERYATFDKNTKTHNINYPVIFPDLEKDIIKLIEKIFNLFYIDIYPKLNQVLINELPILNITNEKFFKFWILNVYYLLLNYYRTKSNTFPIYETFNTKTEIFYQRIAQAFDIEHILSKPKHNLSNQINIRKLITAIQFFLQENSISIKITPYPTLLD